MKRMTLNAAELDKYIILNGEFSFQDEILEQASKHEPWSKIVEVINSKKPVLVFDTGNIELYVGNTDEDSMYLTALYNNSGTSHTLTYDRDTDQLRIKTANETFISEDNVKTLFGNQSIIGTGNIDLYRHTIVLEAEINTIQLEYISSNNLVVDSLQDLTALLKPKADQFYFGFVSDTENSNNPAKIVYNGSIWQAVIEGSTVNIVRVSDTVTTI